MPDQKPKAFMSYTRIDNQGLGGHITTLREQLGVAIQIHTGKPFEIFQDVKDIEWGQSAQDRIEASLDEVTFLIPILTPSFFHSGACCDEVLRFLEHETRLGRNDLILPVYYVNHPPFNSPEAREGDEVAIAMAAHQWKDWRELRQESSNSAAVGMMMEGMALDIRAALDRVTASGGPRKTKLAGANSYSGYVDYGQVRAGAGHKVVAKVGDYTSQAATTNDGGYYRNLEVNPPNADYIGLQVEFYVDGERVARTEAYMGGGHRPNFWNLEKESPPPSAS